MFTWDEKRIDWYERALKWSGFAKTLADEVEPYLDIEDTVCDLGCGTGYMASELYQRGYNVTAVDHSETVIDYLKEKAVNEPYAEMKIFCAAWEEILKNRSWDTIVMCFAGAFRTDFLNYYHACKKQLILVTKGFDRTEAELKSEKNYYRMSSGEMSQMLDEEGVPYHSKTIDMEFGQPLKSLQEAEEYHKCYKNKHRTDFFEKLIETQSREFPLYLPIPKRVTIYRMFKSGD